jgi:hypothetical protein
MNHLKFKGLTPTAGNFVSPTTSLEARDTIHELIKQKQRLLMNEEATHPAESSSS